MDGVRKHGGKGSAPALAIGLAAGWMAITAGSFLAVYAARPDWPPLAAAIVPTALVSIIVAALLTGLGWWRRAGFTPAAEWRNLRLLALPALLTLIPFAGGLNSQPVLALHLLVLGYALTGFAEEAFARGILIEVLQPRGALSAAVIAALLFGALHLINILVRGTPAVILAQAVGAACFGFAYGVLRLRTQTVWPLIVLHMATDLFLRLGGLPTIPVAVAQDVVLLAYGALLARRLSA